MKQLLFLLSVFICFSSHAQISLLDYNKAADHHNRAIELTNEQHYEEALLEVIASMELDSTIRDNYLLMFKISHYSKKHEMGVEYLKKALQLFTEDDEIMYYLGKSYQSMKMNDEAIAQFSQAIQFSKQNGEDFPIVYDYYAGRGICLMRQKKYSEALADFDEALRLNETNAATYINRGITHHVMKNYDKACADWEKALELGKGIAKKYLDKNCKRKAK